MGGYASPALDPNSPAYDPIFAERVRRGQQAAAQEEIDRLKLRVNDPAAQEQAQELEARISSPGQITIEDVPGAPPPRTVPWDSPTPSPVKQAGALPIDQAIDQQAQALGLGQKTVENSPSAGVAPPPSGRIRAIRQANGTILFTNLESGPTMEGKTSAQGEEISYGEGINAVQRQQAMMPTSTAPAVDPLVGETSMDGPSFRRLGSMGRPRSMGIAEELAQERGPAPVGARGSVVEAPVTDQTRQEFDMEDAGREIQTLTAAKQIQDLRAGIALARLPPSEKARLTALGRAPELATFEALNEYLNRLTAKAGPAIEQQLADPRSPEYIADPKARQAAVRTRQAELEDRVLRRFQSATQRLPDAAYFAGMRTGAPQGGTE